MKHVFFSLLLLFTTMSCQPYIRDIIVAGLVLDDYSNQPIKNAQVIILCWKPSGFGFDEVDYKKIELTTDPNGKFIANFEKGMRLDLAIKAGGYEIAKLSMPKLAKRRIDVAITMKRSDKVILTREVETKVFFDSIFVGFKDYHLGSGDSTATFGIDIKNGRVTDKKDEADLWAIRSKKEFYPSILTTLERGGLIPIYEKDIKASLMYEKTKAPKEGYIDNYSLKGNEAGFFIKSRDGANYGKLILIPEKTEISTPYKDGYYKENRLSFRLVYQPNGTNDLYVSQDEVDLEQYLLNTLDK